MGAASRDTLKPSKEKHAILFNIITSSCGQLRVPAHPTSYCYVFSLMEQKNRHLGVHQELGRSNYICKNS